MPASKKTKTSSKNLKESEELSLKNNQEDLEGVSIEEAFKRIDNVISTMQQSDITLEDSFCKYKEGMELLRHAGALIDKVEKQAQKLSDNGELEDFEDE